MILDVTSQDSHLGMFSPRAPFSPQTEKALGIQVGWCIYDGEKKPQNMFFLLLAAPGYLLMKWMKRAHQIWSKMKSFLTETCKAILRDSSSKQDVLVQFHRDLVFYGCLLMANSLPNCFDPNKNSAKSLSQSNLQLIVWIFWIF